MFRPKRRKFETISSFGTTAIASRSAPRRVTHEPSARRAIENWSDVNENSRFERLSTRTRTRPRSQRLWYPYRQLPAADNVVRNAGARLHPSILTTIELHAYATITVRAYTAVCKTLLSPPSRGRPDPESLWHAYRRTCVIARAIARYLLMYLKNTLLIHWRARQISPASRARAWGGSCRDVFPAFITQKTNLKRHFAYNNSQNR